MIPPSSNASVNSDTSTSPVKLKWWCTNFNGYEDPDHLAMRACQEYSTKLYHVCKVLCLDKKDVLLPIWKDVALAWKNWQHYRWFILILTDSDESNDPFNYHNNYNWVNKSTQEKSSLIEDVDYPNYDDSAIEIKFTEE